MAGPGVTIREIDLSTRVPSFPGVYGGIVIPAKKGLIGEPTLVTSETQLLDRYTPNGKIEVGYDNAYWSALAFLQKSKQLWVNRAAINPLYGGAFARQYGSTKKNGSTEYGFADPTSYDLDTNNGRQLIAPSLLTTDTATNTNNIKVDATFFQLSRAGDSCTVEAGEGGVLPAPLAADTPYYMIKTNTKNTIRLALTAADAAAGIAITLTADATAPVTINNTAIEAETSAEMKSLLFYGCNQGDWNNNVFIRIFPYRDSEVVALVSPQITVTQDWEVGESVRLSTTGELPEGLDDTLTYYIAEGSDDTHRKIADSITKAELGDTIEWDAESGSGVVTMVPAEPKCKEPQCFALEVFTDQNLSNPVETWICSRIESKMDGYNQGVYVENILEGSNYIRAIDNKTVDESIMPKAQFTLLALDGGSDGDPVTDGAMLQALKAFENTDKVMVTVMMDGGWATPAYQKQGLLALCEGRKDCVAILSTPYAREASSNYLNEIVDYRNLVLNANSSYGGLYTPHVLIYDQYNDRQIYVPPDGYVAAAISETAANYEMWYPPAGFRRGVLNVLDVRRRMTSNRAGEGELGYLYDQGINTIRFYPGKGILIWGQKTLLARPSSLDRMNVRLLLIVIEPAIAEALEDYVFQLNDPAERKLIVNMIESYMEGIKGRRGVYDYYVVCDETNNSAEDIDNKILNVWLFVKPTQAMEFIKFTTVITRTGEDFAVAAQAI